MKNEKLSVSGLKEFSKSLQHYLDYKARKSPQTDPMRFGSALHTAVLEPEKFDKEVIVLDKNPDGRSKDGKKLKEELKGKTYISKKDLKILEKMHTSIFTHPIASHLIDMAPEKEIWLNGKLTCDHGEIDIHGKADCVYNGTKKICIDLKTIGDASLSEISKSIKNYKYHWQAWFYREMLQQMHGETFEIYFIFVDKTEHHNVQIVNLDEEWFTAAENDIKPLLNDFYKYLAEGEEKLYKGYSNTIETIPCPAYVNYEKKNSRFAEPINSYKRPIVDFLGGKKDDSTNKPTISNNEAKNVGIETDKVARKAVEQSNIYEPESNKEVLAAVTEEKPAKPEKPADDVEAVLLVQAEKLEGYQNKEAALQCTIDKVCGPGVKPKDLDFKQKQQVS
jgi:hypothetical protein